MSLRRKDPAPEQGVTLNLRNPDARIHEWGTEAEQSSKTAKEHLGYASRLSAEADDHQRQAGEAAAEEMRLANELAEAKRQRDHHRQQAEAKLGEAKKYAESAQFLEDKAADLRESIEDLKRRMAQQNGNGQVPADPTAETRMDKALARMEEARAELRPDQRQEETPL